MARLYGKEPAVEPAAERILPGMRFPACDATASGAEDAQVRMAKGHLELAFCGHHADLHEIALAISGWRVTHDNREGRC